VELRVARSSADIVAAIGLQLTGATRGVGPDRVLTSVSSVNPVSHHEFEGAL
jgi:hypothetical protein